MFLCAQLRSTPWSRVEELSYRSTISCLGSIWEWVVALPRGKESKVIIGEWRLGPRAILDTLLLIELRFLLRHLATGSESHGSSVGTVTGLRLYDQGTRLRLRAWHFPLLWKARPMYKHSHPVGTRVEAVGTWDRRWAASSLEWLELYLHSPTS
jgi:hypothetical protein